MRDYLAKLAILSQYSGPANALIVPDNGVSDGENGVVAPKTGDQDNTRQLLLSEQNLMFTFKQFKIVRYWFGACQTNPAYLGNVSEAD